MYFGRFDIEFVFFKQSPGFLTASALICMVVFPGLLAIILFGAGLTVSFFSCIYSSKAAPRTQARY